jgi:large subunit ribosomal protein L31
MKDKIHPAFTAATVTCACGNTFETFSTRTNLKVDLCSSCHPFYTGKRRLVDTDGQVDRFMRRLAKANKPAEPVKA